MSDVVKLTEQQAIEFTVAKGYKGEEFKTKAWQSGALKKDGTLGKLVKKLECFYSRVEILGVGKKRVYALTNPKEQPTSYADSDKRKGRTMPRKVENQLLTDYIFQKLFLMENDKLEAVTLNNLVTLIPFVTDRTNCFWNGIKGAFEDYVSEEKYKSVWAYTDWYLWDRAKKDIDLAIERLVRTSKIKVSKNWYAGVEGSPSSKQPLAESLIQEVRKDELLLAEQHEVDYVEYQRSFSYHRQSAKLKSFGIELKQFLKEKYGFEFIYEAMTITIPNRQMSSRKFIPFEQAQATFLTKAINLVKEKAKSDKYLKAQNKGEKFHYLCLLLFLKEQRINFDEIELQKEMDLIPQRLFEIADSYVEKKPIGFGTFPLEKI